MKNTPLHIAAKFGHFLIVKYLVENGANPIIANREGHTPFNFAEESLKNALQHGIHGEMMKSVASAKSLPSSAKKRPQSAAAGSAHKKATLEASHKAHENVEGIKRLLAKSQEGM